VDSPLRGTTAAGIPDHGETEVLELIDRLGVDRRVAYIHTHVLNRGGKAVRSPVRSASASGALRIGCQPCSLSEIQIPSFATLTSYAVPLDSPPLRYPPLTIVYTSACC
jgi:hypothetical protein